MWFKSVPIKGISRISCKGSGFHYENRESHLFSKNVKYDQMITSNHIKYIFSQKTFTSNMIRLRTVHSSIPCFATSATTNPKFPTRTFHENTQCTQDLQFSTWVNSIILALANRLICLVQFVPRKLIAQSFNKRTHFFFLKNSLNWTCFIDYFGLSHDIWII